ncbi:SAP domain superfamily [Arabidopsis suecica]|uniref:SAP domain superfamily n=1 Tax=Arabidopsis suecica TaxID=45249 RepID=A0A8T1YNP3_ARASU|nr:SAP domain superfamily [Arabidopsis suecica]
MGDQNEKPDYEMIEGRAVDTLKVHELKEHLFNLKYPTSGSKLELVKRLDDGLKKRRSEQPESEQQEEEEAPEPKGDLVFFDLEFEKDVVIEFGALIINSKTFIVVDESIYTFLEYT